MHGHYRTLHINTSEVSPTFSVFSSSSSPTFHRPFFHVYTEQTVPAHSRLVYQLSVINLTHAYPGTYVFCFYFNMLESQGRNKAS